MPRYYPDLKSVQDCIKVVVQNEGDKQYRGVYPETECQLPQARVELARYFRTVWADEVAAMEVENAVSKENYDEVMDSALSLDFLRRMPKRRA